MSSVDTAKDLMTFAAGPTLLGTAAVVAYANKILSAPERSPRKGSERRPHAVWAWSHGFWSF